jgi:hypothetical protein
MMGDMPLSWALAPVDVLAVMGVLTEIGFPTATKGSPFL